jgi:O-antigen ligase
VVKERPVLGYGFGSHYDRELTLLPGVGGEGADLEPGVVHSQYLHIWWKMGILGLAAYLWLQLGIFRFGAEMLSRVPSSASFAIALGLYSALIGDVAMEVWAPQWFESTKVSLLIFFSLALIVCLVNAGGDGSSAATPVSSVRRAPLKSEGESC